MGWGGLAKARPEAAPRGLGRHRPKPGVELAVEGSVCVRREFPPTLTVTGTPGVLELHSRHDRVAREPSASRIQVVLAQGEEGLLPAQSTLHRDEAQHLQALEVEDGTSPQHH